MKSPLRSIQYCDELPCDLYDQITVLTVLPLGSFVFHKFIVLYINLGFLGSKQFSLPYDIVLTFIWERFSSRDDIPARRCRHRWWCYESVLWFFVSKLRILYHVLFLSRDDISARRCHGWWCSRKLHVTWLHTRTPMLTRMMVFWVNHVVLHRVNLSRDGIPVRRCQRGLWCCESVLWFFITGKLSTSSTGLISHSDLQTLKFQDLNVGICYDSG